MRPFITAKILGLALVLATTANEVATSAPSVALLCKLRAGIGNPEIDECALDKCLDLIQTFPDSGGELGRCADEFEEARRVHLH